MSALRPSEYPRRAISDSADISSQEVTLGSWEIDEGVEGAEAQPPNSKKMMQASTGKRMLNGRGVGYKSCIQPGLSRRVCLFGCQTAEKTHSAGLAHGVR